MWCRVRRVRAAYYFRESFVASYSPDGAFRWAFSLGSLDAEHGPDVLGLTTDGARVYVGGMLNGPADFDLGLGEAVLGGSDPEGCSAFNNQLTCSPFLAAYDATTGALVLAREFEGDGLSNARDLSLATDGERVYPGVQLWGKQRFLSL